MHKTDINPMPVFFERYIALVDDVDHTKALQISLEEIDQLPIAKWKAHSDKTYAEGKWTIKQILQHLIDTERIFTYRALCIARGEANPLPGFDEDNYAKNADVTHRTIDDLIDEFKLVKSAFIKLFQTFTDEALLRKGPSFKGEYSVLSMAYIMAGHLRWHLQVINERYLKII
jgi:DinB superfamily